MALLLLYYVTDRSQFPGAESDRRAGLLEKIAEAVASGVNYVQLREKDISARDLEILAQEAALLVRKSCGRTRLLINSRTDIALAGKADGVHLTSNDISPVDVRETWREAHAPIEPIVAVSCHNEAEVIAAERGSDRVEADVHVCPAADFVVFGPVFEKRGSTEAAGLDQLQIVCRHRIPVIALGGVTTKNAHLCIEAGAGGIAGIRLFQENDVAAVVTKLRGLK